MIQVDNNIILRLPNDNDKHSVAKYANNYNIWMNLTDTFPFPYTLVDACNFIEYCKNTQSELNLCIELNNDCIGLIGIIFKTGIYRYCGTMGYWLAEPFWNKGVMTKVAKTFVKYIFNNKDITRIESSVFEWNTGSMRVLEKTGFKLECVSKKAIFKNNQFVDEYKYSLLKEEWQGIQ